MQPSAPLRRAATLAATALAVVTAVALTPHSTDASAAQPAKGMTPAAAGQLAKSLTPQLHGEQAGSYYDRATKKLVVNVTTPEAAAKVRKAGAAPRKVRYADKTLAATVATLNAGKPIPGTAWVQDIRANKVMVTADRTVTGKKQDQLNTMLKPLGDKVRLERTDSELKMFISGGERIVGYNTNAYCTLGFSVKRSGKPDAFLTAGHCGDADKVWRTPGNARSEGKEIGVVPAGGVSFPDNDYAIAEYGINDVPPPHPSEVNLYDGDTQEITAARDAVLNEAVTSSGATTGRHDGTVTGLNATLTVEGGQVTGLIQTDLCSDAGDSGGPLFSGTDALGLLSGGTGDCKGGPATTYFQPVVEALTAFGATVG
ncbi:S1 family peptidase [Streptomyces syringium]|uniref:S1 family peptidase n=1 Tax=Streptomyces syringium TaxID=76729 RepID=UPI00341C0F3D